MPKAKEPVLLIVDVQNDFFPKGALPVPNAQEILPIVNRLTKQFKRVIATRDWHPQGHKSFASSHPGKNPLEQVRLYYGLQTLWPNHCVAGTKGAAFHPDLDQSRINFVLNKGTRIQCDSYSAFFENDGEPTGLGELLSPAEEIPLYICGLARNYCVEYTLRDALKLGYTAEVIEEACRGIPEN